MYYLWIDFDLKCIHFFFARRSQREIDENNNRRDSARTALCMYGADCGGKEEALKRWCRRCVRSVGAIDKLFSHFPSFFSHFNSLVGRVLEIFKTLHILASAWRAQDGMKRRKSLPRETVPLLVVWLCVCECVCGSSIFCLFSWKGERFCWEAKGQTIHVS